MRNELWHQVAKEEVLSKQLNGGSIYGLSTKDDRVNLLGKTAKNRSGKMMNDGPSCPKCFTPYTAEFDPYGTGNPMHVVYWAECSCQDTGDEEEDDDTDEEEMP